MWERKKETEREREGQERETENGKCWGGRRGGGYEVASDFFFLKLTLEPEEKVRWK